ncbi:MAG: hypothetical protein RSB67_03275 [Clostridia bacterium]
MKKGFSLVALIATVTIIITLISTITFSAINASNTSKKITFATEINMIQEASDAYKIKNDIYPIKDNVIIDVTKLSQEEKKQFTDNGDVITNNKIVLGKVNYMDIGINNLKNGTLKDTADLYAVSPITGKIYYAKGYIVGSSKYFTLTSSLKTLITINQEKNFKKAEAPVIFIPSTTEYTNDSKGVTITVKVPSSYNTVSVYKDNNNVVPKKNTEGSGEYMYDIYETSDIKNYSIIVKYDGKISTYNVSNIDTKSPDFEMSSFVPVNEPKGDIVGYYKITKKNDNISKIKKIKYEEGVFNNNTLIKDHFEVSGNLIKEDIIPVKKGIRKITVYMEDNAGNWAAKYLER